MRQYICISIVLTVFAFALNRSSKKLSLSESKKGLKLDENYNEDLKDQESGGDHMIQIFNQIDTNGDEFLEKDELVNFLEMLLQQGEITEDGYDFLINAAGVVAKMSPITEMSPEHLPTGFKLDFEEFLMVAER